MLTVTKKVYFQIYNVIFLYYELGSLLQIRPNQIKSNIVEKIRKWNR